jgi:S1-C subfamily serine protease
VPLLRRVVRFYDLPRETGAIVISVEKDSPAERAGLREGDIILSFACQPMAGVDDLHSALSDALTGTPSKLTALRHTEKLEFVVVPEEAR